MKNNNLIRHKNVRDTKQAIVESIMTKIAPIVKKALNESILNDDVVSEQSFLYEATYQMLVYNYKEKEWYCQYQMWISECGAFPTLEECISENLKNINKFIDSGDEKYRYIVMVIDKINSTDGNPIPNSEVFGARVFNGEIVESWDY